MSLAACARPATIGQTRRIEMVITGRLRGGANWLPTPAGLFRPVIRMYQPRPEVLDGTYTLPAVTKTA